MAWSAQKNTNFGSTEFVFLAIPNTDTVFVAYTDGSVGGSPNLKIQKSLDGGNTFAAAVTIAAAIPGGDLQLNEPIAYDPTAGANGRLFVVYGKSIDQAGAKGVLAVRYSDDLGATWSAETILDDGTAHAGLNSFYRVGVWAYNGVVSVHYTYESNSSFTTDGLWRVAGTYTGTGAITWGATGKVYTGTVVNAVEPNVWGFTDGTVIVSWYDPLVAANNPGDIFITRSSNHGQTWDAAATRLTNTANGFGRPRIHGENGTWWIVMNSGPWGATQALYEIHSTDNGVTWSAPRNLAAAPVDHPDVRIQGSFVGILWNNLAGHGFLYSTDGGSTFSTVTNPFGDTSSSDAPRLIVTNSYLIATGYDQANARSMWVKNPDWFAVLPGSQTAVLDGFNRAAENPLSDAGQWTSPSGVSSGTQAVKTNGTQAVRQSGAGSFNRSSARWNTSWPANTPVEVFGTVAAAVDGELNLLIFNPTMRRGYRATVGYQTFNVTNYVEINNTDPTAGTTQLAQFNPYTVAGGDKMATQIIGDQIVLWHFTGGAWVEKARVVDTTYRQAWNIGVEIAGLNQIGPPLDDFGGGSLVVPSNSAAPVASYTGSSVSVTRGTWNNGPVRYTYQWKRDGVAITNATLPFYTTVPTDAGHTLTCAVTAYNQVGASTSESNVVGPIGQAVAPSADISRGTWMGQPGNLTANLYAQIDEAVADDADYVESSASPGSADIYKFRLEAAGNPASHDGFKLSIRTGKSMVGGDTIQLTVKLYAADGTTPIKTWGSWNAEDAPTLHELTLTNAEAVAIPDQDFATGLVVAVEALKV